MGDIKFITEDVFGKRYRQFSWKNPENQKVCLSRVFEYPYWIVGKGLKDIHDRELEAFKKGVEKQLNA